MTFFQRTGLLAGTLGVLLLAALPSQAQQSESQAHQRGYQQGLKDREDSAEPNPGAPDLRTDSDRTAYRSGYQSGYCHNQAGRTGYYNGICRDYGPPVLRNGYYGYNAADPFCEKKIDPALGPQSQEAPQSKVEYAGGAG